jgi:hypothetical protein
MRTRNGHQWSRRGLLGFAVAIAVSAVAGSAFAASSGVCVSAVVSSPILLPDGHIAPAGELRLCDSFEFSPVASLHKTFVNGVPFGMLRSRKRVSEGPVTSPKVLFRADGRGNLELVGYVVPNGNRAVAFLLKREDPPGTPSGSALLARR